MSLVGGTSENRGRPDLVDPLQRDCGQYIVCQPVGLLWWVVRFDAAPQYSLAAVRSRPAAGTPRV